MPPRRSRFAAGPVATPSARASSSGSDITFIRQRNAISTAAPIATGPNNGSRSGDVRRGQAAQQPERHGRQLVVGIGKIFHQTDAGAEQRSDHDAGQHQHQDRIARTHRRADHIDGARQRAGRRGRRKPGSRTRRAKDKCRPRRQAPRPRTRRECRAIPADCGTGPETRCRQPRAQRRPARPQARAAREPAG